MSWASSQSMIVLDSNKDRLGSRWNEQLYWIPEATEGRFDHVLVFMHDPVVHLPGDGTGRVFYQFYDDRASRLLRERTYIL